LSDSTRNAYRSWQDAESSKTVQICFDQDFECFKLKIWKAANYEKCVPGEEEQLLFWRNFECLGRILRYGQDTVDMYLGF
jgi:hypothetical protein